MPTILCANFPTPWSNAAKKNVLPPRQFTGAGSGVPPVWGEWNLGIGEVDLPYLQQRDMPDADHPITFVVTTGSLPTGLSLSSDGHAASISGTPLVSGTFSFTLRATNSTGSSDIATSITINPSKISNAAF